MSFPQYGKNISAFSTLWKKCFHGMESGGAVAPTHNPRGLLPHAPCGKEHPVVGIPNLEAK